MEHHESSEQLLISKSAPLSGEVALEGAKNAVLVSMAALLLVPGVSTLRQVPPSADVFQMIKIIEMLGAVVNFDVVNRVLVVDATDIDSQRLHDVSIMRTFRASTLILGPLLARCGRGLITFPGGDNIGSRPIDFHLRAFQRMGAEMVIHDGLIRVLVPGKLQACQFILDYPSVGATENIIMAAAAIPGTTVIMNAAIEPEVLDLIALLQGMGAEVELEVPGTIRIQGNSCLKAVDHAVMYDRLEAATYLIAAAITGGSLSIPNAPVHYIWETVYERRLGHVRELQRMGAQITVQGDMLAIVRGVSSLKAAHVVASDIRAGAALLLAGLIAEGTTTLVGVSHLYRGYVDLVPKLKSLGASIELIPTAPHGMLHDEPRMARV